MEARPQVIVEEHVRVATMKRPRALLTPAGPPNGGASPSRSHAMPGPPPLVRSATLAGPGAPSRASGGDGGSGATAGSSPARMPGPPPLFRSSTIGAMEGVRSRSCGSRPASLSLPGRARDSRMPGLLRISVTPARGLAKRKHTKHGEVYGTSPSGRFVVRAVASSMLGRRVHNEDAHALLMPINSIGSDCAWCGVFDGHGGHSVATFTAKYLHESVVQQIQQCQGSPASDCPGAAGHGGGVGLGGGIGVGVGVGAGAGAGAGSAMRDVVDALPSPGPASAAAEEVDMAMQTGDADIDMDTDMGVDNEFLEVDSDCAPRPAKRVAPHSTPTTLCCGTRHLSQAFVRGFINHDRRVYHELPHKGVGAGTTALVALITPTHIVVANTGDSRGVLCRAGKALRVSTDHKPTEQLERRRIIAAGGCVKSGRLSGLSVSRALGDFDIKPKPKSDDASRYRLSGVQLAPHPDVWGDTWESNRDEFLVLACDGVWDVMGDQECVNFVRRRLLLHLSGQGFSGGSASACGPLSAPVVAAAGHRPRWGSGGSTSPGFRGTAPSSATGMDARTFRGRSGSTATAKSIPGTPVLGRRRSSSSVVPAGGRSACGEGSPGAAMDTAVPSPTQAVSFASLSLASLQKVADELLDRCFDLGSDDNLTAIIIVR